MERMAYIGTKKCGCTVAVCIDEPSEEKETARCVSEFIQSGYIVERVTVKRAQSLLKSCKCNAVNDLFATA